MSNSTTLLDTILANSANKEALANALFDAASPAMLFGRHASACSGLTWGYYGGQFGSNAIANGTLALTASATNYVQANPSTGAVTSNTSGFTTGYTQLYTIVTGATTVTSYTDLRQAGGGSGGSGTVTSVAGAGGIESPTGAITGSGTLRETMLLSGGAVQTAAYTFVTGDRGSTLVMNSASAISQALPTPTGTTLTTNFPTGWFVALENIGAGTMTLTVPTGTKLDNVTNGTLALAQNTGCSVFTDGTNYFTVRGAATGGGGGFTNPMTTAGDIIIGGSGGTATRLGIGSAGQVLEVVSGAPAWTTPATPGTTAPVALTTYYPGVPTASANLLKALVPLAVTFPAGLAGSVAQCDVAPTAAVTCPILHNGTNVGSVNFAASATTGTMTFTSAVTTTPGDLMVVQAQSSPDATFAGPVISLLGSAPAVSSNTTLASLGDTNIASPAAGQVLEYVSGKWQNTTPTLCAFQAQCSTSQAIPASTQTNVTNWTALRDDSSGAMNFTTGVFTAPVTGWYQAAASVAFASAAWPSGSRAEAVLALAGTAIAAGAAIITAAYTGIMYSPPISQSVYMTAGQTLICQALQSTTGTVDLIGAGFAVTFSVALITPTV
jgi:hypothetical protein